MLHSSGATDYFASSGSMDVKSAVASKETIIALHQGLLSSPLNHLNALAKGQLLCNSYSQTLNKAHSRRSL